MLEHIVTPTDIGTHYATENAQLPSIECPQCHHVTPLNKLVSNKKCENCGMTMNLKLVTE